MSLINFVHSMAVAPAQIISLDRPVAPYAQQLLRYHGVPSEGVAVDTFVEGLPFN